MRKTLDIAPLKERVNKALSLQIVGNTPDYRRGLAAVLEDVLLSADNYNGFRYTDGNSGYTDPTRRHYY